MSITIDTSKWMRAVGQYGQALADTKPREAVIRQQMKLAIKSILALTPPGRSHGDNDVGGPTAHAAGKQAELNDLLRACRPYGGMNGKFSDIKDKKLRAQLRKYSQEANYDALKAIHEDLSRGSNGYYNGWTMVDFSPSLHTSARNSKGRVPHQRFILVPQWYEWNTYLQHLYYLVGYAKGGWTAAARGLGISIPSWVSEHYIGSSYTEKSDGQNTTFTAINGQIKIPDYQSRVKVALEGREKAMRADLERVMANAAKKAGFQTIL